ncbi:GMC family oxidoreductase N-terminal domain-containing protein [Actinocorallia lasiicapitis]
MGRTADYVVVGAGSSGCVVAKRLAESGASVVLLEAGGSDRTALVRKPGLIAVFHNIPQLKKKLDWGFSSAPQANALNRRIPQTRGKVLGGSGSINGMVFVRGNRKNYDDWAADGCTGWSYEDVLPSFRKMENWEGGANDLRGAGGPIQVTKAKDVTPATDAFIEALADTAGVKRNDDYNGETQEGASLFQQSAHGGLRYSSSVGYLDGNELPELEIVLNVTVAKVVIDKGRATGVELTDGTRITATREVILSAGAFGSAQLLMLSGVGPAAHLAEHGIEVVADLPVGDNLHDHLFLPMSFLMKSARNKGTAPYFARGVLKETLRGDTWVSRSVFEGVGFVRSPQATDIPDLQIHVLPWGYPGPNQDAPIRHKVDPRPSLTLLATLIYPKSRGTLRLASADPTAAPVINPNYLAAPEDRRLLLDGMELLRATMASPAIKPGVDGELSPGPSYPDRAALEPEVLNRATTVYHPVGTVRMGAADDPRAVVTPSLKVKGVDGLRVVDCSIIPSITGGNTNAPAMMIGEHAASLILDGSGTP